MRPEREEELPPPLDLTLSSPAPPGTSLGVPNSEEKLEIQGQNRMNYFGFTSPKHPVGHTFIFIFFWHTKRPEMFGFSLFFGVVVLGLAGSCPQFPGAEIKGIWDFGKSRKENRKVEIGCGFRGLEKEE